MTQCIGQIELSPGTSSCPHGPARTIQFMSMLGSDKCMLSRISSGHTDEMRLTQPVLVQQRQTQAGWSCSAGTWQHRWYGKVSVCQP
jgi:hypothetical protein